MVKCVFVFVILAVGATQAAPRTTETEDSIKEGPCLKVTTPIKLTWDIKKVDKWYVPLWSKIELFRTVSSLLDLPVYVIGEDLALHSCVYSTLGGDNEFHVFGFGKQLNYTMTLDKDARIAWQEERDGKPYGISAFSYPVLTDNHSYVVYVTCWDDGQRSFSVNSPTKSLPNKTLNKIKKDVMGLGFNPDYFMFMKYDKCM